MAIDLKGKKSSLEEGAIYQKRDDNMSEKERFKHMTGKEKRAHFATYYLPKLALIAVIAAVAFYIIWVDFINKADTYLRCAILNESINDGVLTEMSDNFTKSLKLDTKDYRSSFYIYYTDPQIAMQMNADTGKDLSEISSRLVANTLDTMIAAPKDVEDSYLKKGFMLDLSTLLNENELEKLNRHLYIPTAVESGNTKPCGIYLSQSSVYQSLFPDREPLQDEPVLFVISNTTDEGKDYARKLIYFLFPELFG